MEGLIFGILRYLLAASLHLLLRFILITDPDLHLPRSGFTSRSFFQVVKHYSELLVLTDKVLVPLS